MDLQMPIMDGIEATKLIREIDHKIPIIALSANIMNEHIERTKEVGMDNHLAKPIEVNKFFKILLQYISKKVDIKKKIVTHKTNLSIPEFTKIDIDVGLSYVQDNKKLYLKILNNFYKDNQNLKLENLNDDEFKRAIHAINGQSATIGATELHAITQKLDRTLDKNLLDEFYKELNLTLNELKVELIEVKNNYIIEATLEENIKNELLNNLKGFALKNNSQGCSKIIEKIETYNIPIEDKELFDNIKKLFSRRKYKKIVELI